MDISTLVIIGLCLILVLNIYASIRVLTSDCYETNQKIIQIFIIWLLPIIGAMLMIYFSDDDFGSGGKSGGGSNNVDMYEVGSNGGAAD